MKTSLLTNVSNLVCEEEKFYFPLDGIHIPFTKRCEYLNIWAPNLKPKKNIDKHCIPPIGYFELSGELLSWPYKCGIYFPPGYGRFVRSALELREELMCILSDEQPPDPNTSTKEEYQLVHHYVDQMRTMIKNEIRNNPLFHRLRVGKSDL